MPNDFDDELSRAHGYTDLADRPEDDRIAIIGSAVVDGRLTVAFVVDDDAKADRYVRKLTARYKVRVLSRAPGPRGSVLVKVGPE